MNNLRQASIILALSLACPATTGCSSSSDVTCGDGTQLVDDKCVAADASATDGAVAPDTAQVAADSTGGSDGAKLDSEAPLDSTSTDGVAFGDAADAADSSTWSIEACPTTPVSWVCSSDCGGRESRCGDYVSCPMLSKFPLLVDRPTTLRLPQYADAPTCASCAGGTQLRGIYLSVSSSAPFIARIAAPWSVQVFSPSCALAASSTRCVKTGSTEVNIIAFTTDSSAPARNLVITPITSSTDSCP